MGVRQIQKRSKQTIFRSAVLLGFLLLFLGQYQNCGSVYYSANASTPLTDWGPNKNISESKQALINKGHAPTEEEITTLTLRPGVKKVLDEPFAEVFQNSSSDSISGFEVKNDVSRNAGTGNYISGKGVIHCRGDIIVLGTLLLDQTVINTDQYGCRLYVSQTVFIQGAIQFSHPNRSNIQITSARGIVMGIRSVDSFASPEIIADRNKISGVTLYDHAGPVAIQIKLGLTPAEDSVVGYSENFINQTNTQWISVGEGLNPNCPVWFERQHAIASGVSCYNVWAGNYMRRSLDFEHVLLNAPHVHNRYDGKFKGLVVAKLKSPELGKYQYDSVFDRAPLLPLIKIKK